MNSVFSAGLSFAEFTILIIATVACLVAIKISLKFDISRHLRCKVDKCHEQMAKCYIENIDAYTKESKSSRSWRWT